MMNLLALSLVLTSLLTAQVWSPSLTGKHQNQKEDDVIVKEGHRVIVVETFDDEGGQHNTKIRISPPQDSISSGVLENVKEKVKQAAHVIPNLGQGLSGSGYGPESGSYQDTITTGPGELICDAFGKCRHKIAEVIDNAKEKVEDACSRATHQTKEIIHEAKELAQEGIIRKKRIAHEAKDKVEDAYEKTKETVSHKAHEAKEVVEDAYDKAKDSGTQKAQQVKESAQESLDKAKVIAKDAKDLGKTIGVDSVKNVSEKTGQAKKIVYNSLKRAFRFMGVINLLGFSIAYGMCFWVTFISSYVLANALNRQQFGLVQSKIYPVYFRGMGFCIAVALFGHLIGRMKFSFTSKAEVFQAINLLLSVLLVLINALYLEPLATKVMFDKLKIEKEEGKGRETLTTESNRAEQEPFLDASPATTLGSNATATAAAAATAIGAASSPPTTVPENIKEEEIRSRVVGTNERLKKLNSCSSFLNILILMALTWHLVYLGQWLHGTCELEN